MKSNKFKKIRIFKNHKRIKSRYTELSFRDFKIKNDLSSKNARAEEIEVSGSMNELKRKYKNMFPSLELSKQEGILFCLDNYRKLI